MRMNSAYKPSSSSSSAIHWGNLGVSSNFFSFWSSGLYSITVFWYEWDCRAAVLGVVLKETCFALNNALKIEAFPLCPIALHHSFLHMSHCLCSSTWGLHKDDSPLGPYRLASISSLCAAADVKLELWFIPSSSSSGTGASLKFFGRLAGTWGSLYLYNSYS